MSNSIRKPAPRTRGDRLEARITSEQKALIQRAAELEGRTVTDFVITSVQSAAKRALEEHEVIVLGAADSRAFVQALLETPAVSERMRNTARRYRAVTEN